MSGGFGLGPGVPPRALHAGTGRKQIGARWLTLWLACVVCLVADSASPHDASSYGGVFRSRDFGATWLNADVGLFLNAALVIAVDPRDSSHLLVGTDLGILSSRNGGRNWVAEARDVIFGAVFAVAFSADGEFAMCAAASGVFRRDQNGWLRAEASESALPARALVAGTTNDRLFLLGPNQLFASKDDGRTYAVVPGLSQRSEMTALAAIPGSANILAAAIDGRAMISRDGGRNWRDAGFGGRDAPVDTIAADPTQPQRIWAAASGQIVVSDDLGSGWHSVGSPLPETRAKVRGIVASTDAMTLVVSSDRGIYRTVDGGETWATKEDNLPIHVEAGLLARDPNDAGVIYVVFSLMSYTEVWRAAIEHRSSLTRTEPISVAGRLSFCLLVLIGGGLARYLLHRRASAAHSPR
jgi:photosystem II stability/assembly factor-like uncharacterized protein